ncbi:MAG: hypothetical protein CL947_03740 [Epsilonproteobacteria bacterium]|nr:hypothetical protein [Campylobacterota bacterium]|tara:strand:+ start:4859 stop:5242 length:384 start_codon:yes stop_codon:yes gene_type:complete
MKKILLFILSFFIVKENFTKHHKSRHHSRYRYRPYYRSYHRPYYRRSLPIFTYYSTNPYYYAASTNNKNPETEKIEAIEKQIRNVEQKTKKVKRELNDLYEKKDQGESVHDQLQEQLVNLQNNLASV